jgi:hypothetical protein
MTPLGRVVRLQVNGRDVADTAALEVTGEVFRARQPGRHQQHGPQYEFVLVVLAPDVPG